MTTASPAHTASALPYAALADEIAALLQDTRVRVPPRQVLALPGGASLFVMPAHDAQVAMCKLISYTPGNPARGAPAIQGEVLVFDAASGRCIARLDGPTVTARRTAAVTLLAARRLMPHPGGALGIVGAGVQARAHLEAFAQGLGVREVHIASRGAAAAQALAQHAREMACSAYTHESAEQFPDTISAIVTCTSASSVVLRGPLGDDVFVAAIGSFTPEMIELDPALTRWFHRQGRIVLDSADARHEAGDLLQAGVNPARLPTLADALAQNIGGTDPPPLHSTHCSAPHKGPLLFKSCGWAGWDLAAARLAARRLA